MNSLKIRDPSLTTLPTIGFVAIELEVKNEQFRLCFMSQNRAVVENKRVLPVLVPSPGTWSPSSCQRITRDRNTFKQ